MITIPRTMQESLLSGEMLKVGQMVACRLIPQMEVYGFVPMKEDDSYLDFNMQNTRIVANRLVIKMHEVRADKCVELARAYPIYKTIEHSQGEGKQLPLRFLRVIPYEGVLKYYDEYLRSGRKGQLLKDENIIMLQEEGSSIPYYKVADDDFYFRDDETSPIKAIAKAFLVICRRINTITGTITYELYNASDISPIQNDIVS